MPPIETAGRHQKAVLWRADGFDAYGNVLLLDAHEIDVRWEEGRKEAVSPDGSPVAIDAYVVVDREVPIGSVLWLGALADLPSPPTNLKRVEFYLDVPDIKGRISHKTLALMKYSDDLPDDSTGTGT